MLLRDKDKNLRDDKTSMAALGLEAADAELKDRSSCIKFLIPSLVALVQ